MTEEYEQSIFMSCFIRRQQVFCVPLQAEIGPGQKHGLEMDKGGKGVAGPPIAELSHIKDIRPRTRPIPRIWENRVPKRSGVDTTIRKPGKASVREHVR
jgi:hypothetical protein